MTSTFRVAVLGIGCSVANAALAVEPGQAGVAATPNAPSGTAPSSISYSSSPGCPSEADFWRHVSTHLHKVPSGLSQPIQIEAFAFDTGSLVRVTFAGAGTSRDVRELSAPSCAEAVAAAALVVALALDARRDKPPSSARVKNQLPRPAKPPETSVLSDEPSPPSHTDDDLHWLFGGGGFVEYAVAPSPLFGATAFAGLSWPEQRWDVRAGFAYSTTGTVEKDAEAAKFWFIGARIDGCAFPFVHGRRLALHPCVAAALGSVQSRGDDSPLYRGVEKSTFWAAAGPLLRARQEFSELSLELHAGPWIPIAGTRTFVFRKSPEDEQSFHDVPPVGVIAGASLAFVAP
jgi:hypothetical protein